MVRVWGGGVRRVNWAAGYSFEGIYRLGRGSAVRGWGGVRRVNWVAGFMRRYIYYVGKLIRSA